MFLYVKHISNVVNFISMILSAPMKSAFIPHAPAQRVSPKMQFSLITSLPAADSLSTPGPAYPLLPIPAQGQLPHPIPVK